MLQHSLARSERAGNCRNAASRNRKQSVYYALPRDERLGRRKFFLIRSAAAHRPTLQHANVAFGLSIRYYRDRLFDRKLAARYFFDRARNAVRYGDLMDYDLIFAHGTEHVAALHDVALFCRRLERPFLFAIYRRRVDTAVYPVARQSLQTFERTLYTVVYTAYKTRCKFDRKRLLG